jgi:hypothetical protein
MCAGDIVDPGQARDTEGGFLQGSLSVVGLGRTRLFDRDV